MNTGAFDFGNPMSGSSDSFGLHAATAGFHTSFSGPSGLVYSTKTGQSKRLFFEADTFAIFKYVPASFIADAAALQPLAGFSLLQGLGADAASANLLIATAFI